MRSWLTSAALQAAVTTIGLQWELSLPFMPIKSNTITNGIHPSRKQAKSKWRTKLPVNQEKVELLLKLLLNKSKAKAIKKSF